MRFFCMIIRAIYWVLSWVCAPFVFVHLIVRGILDGSYRERRLERFGFAPRDVPHGSIWFHAVSAGEVNAAVPLIHLLRETTPGLRVLVTTTTPAGSAEVSRRLKDIVAHCYAPYDLPWAVGLFLKRVRPSALLLVETELWPHLVRKTAKREIPVYLINARLSQKSARGYARLRGLTAATLASLSGIACQYEDSADRFRRLRVPDDRIHVTGNVKWDAGHSAPLSDSIRQNFEQLRKNNDTVWIAGSTHPGEEEVALQAHREIQQVLGNVALVLAPRHVDRSMEVMELCRRSGLQARGFDEPTDDTDVIVVNQMGYLAQLFAFAKVAFIGGSLQGTGGHNPIEAAVHGVPVVMGPDQHNFEEICRRFRERDCLAEVRDAGELSRAVIELVKNADEWNRQSKGLLDLVASNQGALTLLHALVQEWLGSDSKSQTSS